MCITSSPTFWTTTRLDACRPGSRIQELLDEHPLSKILTSMPGIGTRTGARVLIDVGDASAFPTAAHLASYAGLAPAIRSSGSSIRGSRQRTTWWSHGFFAGVGARSSTAVAYRCSAGAMAGPWVSRTGKTSLIAFHRVLRETSKSSARVSRVQMRRR